MAGARAVAPGFFPLDRELGLGREQWAPPLEAVIALVGTLLPFAYGSDLL